MSYLEAFDPTATLAELQRWASAKLGASKEPSLLDDPGAAQAIQVLNDHITGGGGLPDDWQPNQGKQVKTDACDLIVVSWDADSETYEVSARRNGNDDNWSVFEGTAEEIDTLMSLARDVMTGG